MSKSLYGPFPYATMEEAVKDGFAKLGGADEGLRYLRTGFKQLGYRQKSNEKQAELRKTNKAIVNELQIRAREKGMSVQEYLAQI